MPSPPPPFSIKPTVLENAAGITAANPFGDLPTFVEPSIALDGWTSLQVAVGETLPQRLTQCAHARARAWARLAHAR